MTQTAKQCMHWGHLVAHSGHVRCPECHTDLYLASWCDHGGCFNIAEHGRFCCEHVDLTHEPELKAECDRLAGRR